MIAANERPVLDAVASVLPLNDLPRLLWWVAGECEEALWRQEELGLEVADGMAGDGDVGPALNRWVEALAVAHRRWAKSGDPRGPRPVWAFWTNYTRKGEPESSLSRLLREQVGFPSDQDAGFSAEDSRGA